MPDASLVVTLHDRYSDAAKKMATATKHFSKDAEVLERQLTSLDKNKYALKLDARKAREELRAAEKQFEKTGDAADRFQADLKAQSYERIQRNLRAVTKAAREAETQLSSMDNRAGTTALSTGKKITSALAAAGVGQMASQLLEQGGAALAGSALGGQAGGILAGALSMAANGAAAGFMVGGPTGALVGGLAGAAGGALTGGMQAFGRKDESFKSFVKEGVDGELQKDQDTLTTGSGIAASREMDLNAFTTLLGDRGIAEAHMKDLVDMANRTPYLFEDLKSMSKVLSTYQYGIEEIMPALTDIGDAGAALGMDAQNMGMVATGLGRMRSSGKTTLEYLNLLQERGINAIGYLGEALGISNGGVYDRISKGQINGKDAARIIQQGMHEDFSGAMAVQSGTFGGLTSTVSGLEQEQAAAMGQGFNTVRKGGLQAQIDFLSGESGAGIREAYNAMGAWEGSLQNSKEKHIRDAMTETMGSEGYLSAKAEGDAVTMGRLLKEAELRGVMEYNASEGAQLKLESEKALVATVRNDASLQEEYWNAGYIMGLEFDKGIMNARMGQTSLFQPTGNTLGGRSWEQPLLQSPVELNDGKTQAGGGGPISNNTVTVSGNKFEIRDEGDVEKVAAELLSKLELASNAG